MLTGCRSDELGVHLAKVLFDKILPVVSKEDVEETFVADDVGHGDLAAGATGVASDRIEDLLCMVEVLGNAAVSVDEGCPMHASYGHRLVGYQAFKDIGNGFDIDCNA